MRAGRAPPGRRTGTVPGRVLSAMTDSTGETMQISEGSARFHEEQP